MNRRRKSADIKDLAVSGPECSLVAALARQVDGLLLEVTSAADFGISQSKNMAALKALCAAAIKGPLQLQQHEVLTLVQLSEADGHEAVARKLGPSGHAVRAFSCAVLLQAACTGKSDGVQPGLADTLAQLIASLKHLSPPPNLEARQLVHALLEKYPEEQMAAAERVLLESGLLWFQVQDLTAPETEISMVLDRIARMTRGHFDHISKHWGLTAHELALPDMTSVGLSPANWATIADDMCEMPLHQLSKSVADKIGIHAELLRRAVGVA